MTVTYTAEVATVKGFGCFLRLLFRFSQFSGQGKYYAVMKFLPPAGFIVSKLWYIVHEIKFTLSRVVTVLCHEFQWKGSIYKLVWPDLALFLALYYVLNITYRFFLDDEQKRVFESITEYCEAQSNFIPLSFVLGFYVSIVMTRWWDQYNNIPWPDPIAVYVSAHVHGQDERGRLMRRTIMRYCCLCLTIVFTMISPRVKKRFPTMNHFVEAGLLLENEKLIICDLDEKFPRHAKHWLPIVWAASIVTRARKEGRIRDDFAVKTIIDELNKFRGMCGQLLNYDSISVPLVYTQVVTLAVYAFFATCIMGRQWIDKTSAEGIPSRYKIDLYFPIFTMLQFFFYMGWLKVAESLINPFGEDDDDFEVNWLVDRNLQVSYLIVDEMHHEHPELIKDQYWDEVFPIELPYTVAAEPFREEHPKPSTANIEIPKSAAEITSLKADEMGDHTSYQYDDNTSGIHFFAGKRSSSRIGHRDRGLSGSSSSSTINLGSVAHSINRVGSITSMLKNIFTRESSAPPEKMGSQPANLGQSLGTGRIHSSHSAASLPKSLGTGGTLRITDQVIEEVDEQMTITSMRRPSPDRINVRDIFSNSAANRPPASDPVDVPLTNMNRPYNISTSAPPQAPTNLSEFALGDFESSIQSAPGFESPTMPTKAEMDDVSLGSSKVEYEEEIDEFTRLKMKRPEEKRKRKIARSISRQEEGDPDRDVLLMAADSDPNFP